jgi:hypothetical protein
MDGEGCGRGGEERCSWGREGSDSPTGKTRLWHFLHCNQSSTQNKEETQDTKEQARGRRSTWQGHQKSDVLDHITPLVALLLRARDQQQLPPVRLHDGEGVALRGIRDLGTLEELQPLHDTRTVQQW